MTGRSKTFAALALAALLGAPALAQQGPPAGGVHDHSRGANGGATLSPTTVTINGSETIIAGASETLAAGATDFMNGQIAQGTGGSYVSGSSVTGAALDNTGATDRWAVSIDGFTESTGCFVIASMSDATPTGHLQFTSTTTSNVNMTSSPTMGTPAVLKQRCVPGQTCRISFVGTYRLQDITDGASAALSGLSPASDTNRCNVHGTAGTGGIVVGRFMNNTTGVDKFVYTEIGQTGPK